jgi:hypothetical protein
MREVSAHAQNDNRSVAAEIFAIGTYFLNTPRVYIYAHHRQLHHNLQHNEIYIYEVVVISKAQKT